MMAGAWVRCLALPQHTLIGYDRDPKVRQAALQEAWVDSTIDDLTQAPAVDVILLAMPVDGIIDALQQLQQMHLPPTTLVTDIGSVKAPVMAAAQPLIAQGVSFVGGHPMVGSEHSGWRSAQNVVLAGQPYFLVAPEATAKALPRLRHLLQGQPRFVPMTASAHDALMAQLSHAPHIAASALVNATQLSAAQLQLAAGGFRDTTRIAMADPAVWTAISESNRTALAKQVAAVQAELTHFQALLADGQRDELFAWFQQAHQRRQEVEEG
jgi:prephenate dehydrogenase